MGNKTGNTQTLHKTVTEILSQLHRLRDELSKVTFAVQIQKTEAQSCVTSSSSSDATVEVKPLAEDDTLTKAARATMDLLTSAGPLFVTGKQIHEAVKAVGHRYADDAAALYSMCNKLKKQGVKLQMVSEARQLGCLVHAGTSGVRLYPSEERIRVEQEAKRSVEAMGVVQA